MSLYPEVYSILSHLEIPRAISTFMKVAGYKNEHAQISALSIYQRHADYERNQANNLIYNSLRNNIPWT